MPKTKMPLKLTLFRDKMIKEYYGEDMLNVTELASLFHLSRQSVYNILGKEFKPYEK
jgi:predicted DNA-binding protein YlxM (UPF0122 family)